MKGKSNVLQYLREYGIPVPRVYDVVSLGMIDNYPEGIILRSDCEGELDGFEGIFESPQMRFRSKKLELYCRQKGLDIQEVLKGLKLMVQEFVPYQAIGRIYAHPHDPTRFFSITMFQKEKKKVVQEVFYYEPFSFEYDLVGYEVELRSKEGKVSDSISYGEFGDQYSQILHDTQYINLFIKNPHRPNCPIPPETYSKITALFVYDEGDPGMLKGHVEFRTAKDIPYIFFSSKSQLLDHEKVPPGSIKPVKIFSDGNTGIVIKI